MKWISKLASVFMLSTIMLGSAHAALQKKKLSLWTQQPGESTEDFSARMYLHQTFEALHNEAKSLSDRKNPHEKFDEYVSTTMSHNPYTQTEMMDRTNQALLAAQRIQYKAELIAELPQIEGAFQHENAHRLAIESVQADSFFDQNPQSSRPQKRYAADTKYLIINLARNMRHGTNHIKRPVYRVNNQFDGGVFLVPADGRCMSRVIDQRGYDVVLDMAKDGLDMSHRRHRENRQIMAMQMQNIFLSLTTADHQLSETQQAHLNWLHDAVGKEMYNQIENFNFGNFQKKCRTDKQFCKNFIDYYYKTSLEYIEATPPTDGVKQSVLDVIGHTQNLHYHRVTRVGTSHEARTTEHYGEHNNDLRRHVFALVSDDYSEAFSKKRTGVKIGEHVDQIIPLFSTNTINWDEMIMALRLERSKNLWAQIFGNQVNGIVDKIDAALQRKYTGNGLTKLASINLRQDQTNWVPLQKLARHPMRQTPVFNRNVKHYDIGDMTDLLNTANAVLNDPQSKKLMGIA